MQTKHKSTLLTPSYPPAGKCEIFYLLLIFPPSILFHSEIKESDYGSTHSLENSKSIIYCVHGRETRHCDEDHDNLDIQKGEICKLSFD